VAIDRPFNVCRLLRAFVRMVRLALLHLAAVASLKLSESIMGLDESQVVDRPHCLFAFIKLPEK
jgi:hypothetical protein